MSSSEGRYSLYADFVKGLWDESPVFRQILGMCPTLAVTNTAVNGMSMGLATTFVLLSSGMFASLLKNVLPRQVRLAAYVVIIATFVTVADLFLAAQFPVISKALGPYVPLIVVNCLILGRAESFASRHPVTRAVSDAAGMGLGFLLSLTFLGMIREILGSGSLFGFVLFGDWFDPWLIMVLPPGAFITLGILIGLYNHVRGEGG